jgi:4-aminobutyrate aminotransferase/(S)-3-amino-2-methylpropionate transaminase
MHGVCLTAWAGVKGQATQESIMNAPITAPIGSNKEWVERRAKAVSRGIGMGAPVMAAKAENSEIWDIEGNRYIDFGGGIAVVNTGHRHPW